MLLLAWLPFYAMVSLIGPWWLVFPSMAVWLGCLALVISGFKPHPLRTLFVGLAAIALWHAAGYLFDAAFGWTA